MFKKLISTLLMFSILLVSAPVRAYDLGAAFNSITGSGTATVNDPGVYKSVNRNVISGGGIDVRIPQTRLQLFSITPPSVRFACGSISAHFGGFSFISGDQIEKMIQNISQAALGFILVLAIKTLCPQCESVLQVMKTLAQRAAAMAADSCKVGLDLANKIGPKIGIGSFDENGNYKPSDDSAAQEEPMNVCGVKVVSRNAGPDFLSAMNSVCVQVDKAVEQLKKFADQDEASANGPEDVTAKRLIRAAEGGENSTWTVLNEYTKRGAGNATTKRAENLLIMSMLGTTAWTEAAPYNATGASAAKSQPIAPTLNANEVVFLYLCGASGIPGDASIQVFKMCQQYSDGTTVTANGPAQSVQTTIASKLMMDCADNDYQFCRTVKMVPITGVLSGTGVAVRVDKVLRNAVARVRADLPLMKNGQAADAESAEIMALLASAPFPIYQVINLAAVYPAQADELLRNLGVFYSQLLVKSILLNALNVLEVGAANPAPSQATAMILQARQALSSMKVVTKQMENEMVESWKAQQFMTDTIRQLNLSLQKEVLSPSMIVNNATAINLSNALSGNQNGAPTTPNAPATP